MIGFPQRPQNENCGQANPAMISLSRLLISFLQLSHLWTSIDEKELCWCGLELCDTGLVLQQLVFVPAVSRPDAPLSLSRFQARQLFDIVPTRLVIRVLRKDIEKPVENAQKPGIAPSNASR